MKRSNRLILLIGVFLAALAFVFVIILLSGNSTPGSSGGPTAPPSKLPTVVASRDIALGVAISKDMVTTQQLAPEARQPGALNDPSQAIGQIARASIKAGQQVTSLAFSEASGVNFQCPAGFTCMSVQVDQVSGVGTLIKTGDFVDVIASVSPTFPINYFLAPGTTPLSNGAAVYDPTSVKVLLQGLQVVGTLLPPPPAAQTGAASPAPSTGGTALNGQQEIVILAATTQQAEVIKFAQMDGTVTLALRSPKDFVDDQGNPIIPAPVTTTGIVLQTMIDNWGVLKPAFVIVPAPAPLR